MEEGWSIQVLLGQLDALEIMSEGSEMVEVPRHVFQSIRQLAESQVRRGRPRSATQPNARSSLLQMLSPRGQRLRVAEVGDMILFFYMQPLILTAATGKNPGTTGYAEHELRLSG